MSTLREDNDNDLSTETYGEVGLPHPDDNDAQGQVGRGHQVIDCLHSQKAAQ